MATVDQLAHALAEVRQQLGEVPRLATEAQRAGVQTTVTSTGQVDPRVMNKCPTFSGRDTEWSEGSFIFESVAAMANLEPGAFTGLAEKPLVELTPGMKLGAKKLNYLLVNTVRREAVTLVRSAEKHHGIAAWNRIKTEYQPDATGRHTALLMGIVRPGWDSRGAADTFLDRLTEWERRIQEYEGESLETFSDGMNTFLSQSEMW